MLQKSLSAILTFPLWFDLMTLHEAASLSQVVCVLFCSLCDPFISLLFFPHSLYTCHLLFRLSLSRICCWVLEWLSGDIVQKKETMNALMVHLHVSFMSFTSKYAEAGFLGERVDNYFAASWFLCCSSALTPASQSLAEDFCC